MNIIDKVTNYFKSGREGPSILAPAPLALAVRLRYLIDLDDQLEGADSEITEVGYEGPKPKHGIGARYCNLYDQTGTDKYGPYLEATDTAEDYSERVVNPNGAGWNRLLKDQCDDALKNKFGIIEWDNPDGYPLRAVMGAVEYAYSRKLLIIAKNPLLCTGNPVPYVSHPGVIGVVVERGAGECLTMDELRKRAGKPMLPIWFVAFNADGKNGESWIRSIARRMTN